MLAIPDVCVPITSPGTDGWTEWFAATDFDPSLVHSKNYSRALEAVDRWIESAAGVPQARFAAAEAFLDELASRPVTETELVARGMPWGGLQQKLTGKRLSPSQFFDEAPPDKTNRALEMQVGPPRCCLVLEPLTIWGGGRGDMHAGALPPVCWCCFCFYYY